MADTKTDKTTDTKPVKPVKKQSAWIQLVKKVQTDEGVSYKEAMQIASTRYTKKTKPKQKSKLGQKKPTDPGQIIIDSKIMKKVLKRHKVPSAIIKHFDKLDEERQFYVLPDEYTISTNFSQKQLHKHIGTGGNLLSIKGNLLTHSIVKNALDSIEGAGFITKIVKDGLVASLGVSPKVYSALTKYLPNNVIDKVKRKLAPDEMLKHYPIYDGEKHALLKLPNGTFYFGSFIGPGTKVIRRIKENIPALTAVDETASLHDIQFSLACDEADVRTADENMLMIVSAIEKQKKDSKLNIAQAKLISAKVALENYKVISPTLFTGKLPLNLSQEDRGLLESKQKELIGIFKTKYGVDVKPVGGKCTNYEPEK